MSSRIPSPDETPASADERWIDAALREHARLGTEGSDEELILRILRATVDRPAAAARKHSRNRRGLIVAGAAVAASVALSVILLSNISVDTTSRRSDELRFVVHIAEPVEETPPLSPNPPPRLAAPRHAGAVEWIAPSEPVPGGIAKRDDGRFELVTEFGPTFASLPRRTVRDESFRITADHSETTPEAVTYGGNVIVEHALFRVEASSVRVPAAGRAARGPTAPLQARQVRVIQPGIDCVAEAETLKFDPVAGTLVLTGVRRVETERGELDRFAKGDRLVLSPSGFSVETAPLERHADPGLLKR
jgi:lipopolysaccharide export system protein LptA